MVNLILMVTMRSQEEYASANRREGISCKEALEYAKENYDARDRLEKISANQIPGEEKVIDSKIKGDI